VPLLLVSDQPMVVDGIKTEASDKVVTTTSYVDLHVKIGIESLQQLINKGITVKHLLLLSYAVGANIMPSGSHQG
jgi:AMP nucleosidase